MGMQIAETGPVQTNQSTSQKKARSGDRANPPKRRMEETTLIMLTDVSKSTSVISIL